MVRVVDRRRAAPDIKIMMQYPTARAIVLFGYILPRNGKLFQSIKQRHMTLGQAGQFCRPVVHLRIDIDRVLAVPRRALLIVPQPLQVRGLGARSAAGNHEITSILKEQCCKLRVIRPKGLEPLVGRHRYLIGRSKI